MTAPVFPSTLTPAVTALAQVLWAALDAPTLQSGKPWPYDSRDFSALSNLTISVHGTTGLVTFAFTGPESPVVRGTLDLAKLEALLSSAPNYLDYDSPSAMGPASSVELTSPAFTAQKSGVVYITAEFDGTQSAQDVVSAQLYRDYGLPGQVTLKGWNVTPGGGVGTNYWSGHIHDIDDLPDQLPHTYTVIATGAGGSQLSVAQGAITLMVFELGGPG